MAVPSNVIDWDEAMEQCGDDEEFLRELLGDLKGETDAQLTKIEETIRNPSDQPFHKIMRASHVIKGAASNLMCAQLRTAAMQLEQAASTAHESGGGADMEKLRVKYVELKTAVDNYHAFLQSIGV